MTIKETKRELHKEIMDYIDAIVTNMPNPDDNRTERAYALAFECAMSVFFGKNTIEDRIKKLEEAVFKPVITESIDQIIDQIEALQLKKAYKPKYKVGDILRMDYNPPYANYTFIEIANIAHHISPIDGKSELYYECVNGQHLKCKGFDNNSLFELIWRKK